MSNPFTIWIRPIQVTNFVPGGVIESYAVALRTRIISVNSQGVTLTRQSGRHAGEPIRLGVRDFIHSNWIPFRPVAQYEI